MSGNCLPSKEVLAIFADDPDSFERIMFLVEHANWFYETNHVDNDPTLKSLTLKEFTSLLFNSFDVFTPYVTHIDDILNDFIAYKSTIPVMGAIILDETYERCLLVKRWKKSSWSFPGGKKGKNEEDHECARHKVLEQTGFDISKLLKEDEFFEFVSGQQRVRLYIVAGVRDDTVFAPLTKKKTSEITWHPLNHLESESKEVITNGPTGLQLYMVAPFLTLLQSWITKHPSPVVQKPSTPPKALCVWKSGDGGGVNVPSTTESYNRKPKVDDHPKDTEFGDCFRSFKINTTEILHLYDSVFTI